MMKFKSKLSLVLLMILSFIVLMGATTSLLVRRDAASAKAETIKTETTSWYDVSYDDTSLTILLSANLSDYSELNKDAALKLKDTIVEAFRSLVMEKLLGGSTAAGISAGARSAGIPMPIEAPTGDSVLGEYAEKLRERLSEKGDDDFYEFEKYLNGEYDSVIKYAVSQYIEKHPELEKSEIEKKIEEATKEVQSIVEEVIDEVAVSDSRIEENKEDLKSENTKQSDKVKEDITKVVEEGGKVTLSVTELLSMLRSLTVNDIEIYSNGKFHISGIKQLLSSLPKLSEIAKTEDGNMRFDFQVSMDTTMGKSEFKLTVGFKGDCTNVRRIAKFIADHIDIVSVDGKYNVKITLPDAFGAALARLANSDAIPDEIKHNVFAMFGKTGNELLEDFKTNYTYDQILEYVKSTDFRKIFASLIDAEKIKSFLNGYDVDLSEFSQEKIDKFINDVFGYLKKISENQSVDGIKDFLKGLGINGMPEQLEKAAQKFFDLLKEIDFEYWNAETFKEFINDETAFNAKFDELIQRATNSETARKIYDKLVGYIEKFFNKLPETLKESSILDLYNGKGEILWDGIFNIDVKGTLTSILNKIAPYMDSFAEGEGSYADKVQSLIDTWFDGEMTVERNVSLNVTASNIYKVEYAVKSKTVKTGLLPAGADVKYFADMKEANGRKIVAWVDGEGNVVEGMPEADTTVYAVTQFTATLYNGATVARNVVKTYDGKSVVLTAKAENGCMAPNAKLTYQWFKDGLAMKEATGSEVKITDIKESGAYYCVISYTLSDGTEISAKSRTITVTINKILVDLSVGEWTLDTQDNYYVYDGTEKKVEFVLPADFALPENVEYEVVGNTGINAGTYKAYIKITNSEPDMYEVKLPAVGDSEENAFEWKISPVEIEFTQEPALSVTSVEYDKEEHTTEFSFEANVDTTIFNGVVEDETLLTKTDAGVYTVKVKFTIAQDYVGNYVFNGETEIELTWEITKKVVELTEEPALYVDDIEPHVNSIVYDGKEHNARLAFKTDVDDGILVAAIDKETELTQTNAGVYKVVVTLSVSADNENNYAYDGQTKFTLTWEITKFEAKVLEIPTLEVADAVKEYEIWTVVYDGKEHEAKLTYKTNVDEEVLVGTIDKQENLKQTKAGVYTITITFAIAEAHKNNYIYNGVNQYMLTWIISKATLDFSDSYWGYGDDNTPYEDGCFVYDGTVKTLNFVLVESNGKPIPEGIKVGTPTGNFNISAATYTAKIELTGTDDENYLIVMPQTSFVWKIEQAKLDLEGYAWNYPEPFVYDGEQKLVILTSAATVALPNGVQFSYSGNRATNAGTYVASVSISGNYSSNYYVANAPSELTWTINKAKIDITNYKWKWTADSFDYSQGSIRQVKLVSETLEEKIELVKYTDNKQIAAGEYTAKAYFRIKADFAVNYEFAENNYIEHSWTIKETGGSGSLHEKVVTVGDSTITVNANVSDDVLETLKVEESTASYSNEQFNPWAKSGTHAEIVKVYSISMALPKNFSGVVVITVSDNSFDGIDAATVHVPVGTTEISTDTCEGLATTTKGNAVSFNTSSFSDFVIINQIANEKQNLWWVWLIDAIILVLLIVIIILIIRLLKSKKNNETQDDDTMVVIDAPEEENEEADDDDDDDDDDETAAVALPDDDDDDDEGEEDGGAPVVIAAAVPANDADERSIYNKSFTARLSQADDVIKSYYSELKNDILAYKGVKSRISWSFDTFNKGREKYIKLQIRGKSLYMYIALNPADLDEKYHVKDVSEMSRYATVPTMLKIRKPRSLKYAKELVAKLMENMGIARGETPNIQYKIDYKSNEALLQVGLIKIKVSKSNFEDINKKDGNN